MRRDVLRTLSRWAAAKDAIWAERIVPFLRDVWPRQRAVRTPDMAARLVDLVLSVPTHFASLVPLVLPRLVPLRRYESQLDGLDEGGPDDLVERHALEVLDLLWAVLGEDFEGWPYGIGLILERLAGQSAVAGDSRLSELRRRLQG